MFKLVEESYINSLLDRISELESFLKVRDTLSFEKKKNQFKRKIIFKEYYDKFLETGLCWYNLDEKDMDGEIWKKIENAADGYFVSNFGRIKSSLSRFNSSYWILKQQKQKFGYLRVTFLKKKSSANFVHRVVATAFLDNPYNKPDVNHKNGNKEDNRVENLEWCTESENIRHAISTGLKIMHKGEKHNLAKLTNLDVLNIKKELFNKTNQYELAKKYNVTQTCISNINRGITWSHLKINLNNE